LTNFCYADEKITVEVLLRAKPIRSTVAFDRNASVWAKDQPPVNAALRDNLEVDVAIVGVGNTGLSAAYHIKRS
jgi:hypothetical protein